MEKTARALAGNVAKVVVPIGQVVVHNHIKPARIIGARGFRAWLESRKAKNITVCDCGWAPELGQHFRVRRKPLVLNQQPESQGG